MPVVVAGVTTCRGGRENRTAGRRGTGDYDVQEREVCVMQSAGTVLDVIRDRGKRGLPLERIYRQLFNRDLFLVAYGRIYRNNGAMTPGVTGETVDGMSMAKIDAIIERLRSESYRWTPVKRVYIEKKGDSKKKRRKQGAVADRVGQCGSQFSFRSALSPPRTGWPHCAPWHGGDDRGPQ
ncbi:hypothetical protein BJ996_007371 [Streptomyces phaeogriseichromatogenes]|nr:hypothetical protein [Streptomyces murinus]